ncbi:MAG: DNA modification methylase [Crocinitomicaceae bacterium]|nr:DNA modification methylase [Crocinitomicaceae bacterium]
MNRNTQSYVEHVKPESIFRNEELGKVYNLPENYQAIKENIKEMGIITPLIVNSNNMVIVSGNLRHAICIELSIPLIPVYFVDIQDDLQLVSLSSNLHREKTTMEKYNEMKLYKTLFGIRKGHRTDLNPELQKLKEERDVILSSISKDTRNKLNSIATTYEGIYGNSCEELEKVFSNIDKGIITLNKAYTKANHLKVKSNCNQELSGGDYVTATSTIYNKSSEVLIELEDGTISVVCSSPPYLGMKIYQLDSNQLGQEPTVEEYINNLKKHYLEVYRVLKKDGSVWVNINDCCKDGEYQLVPQRFVLMMKSIGFILNDEFQWLKQNPRPTGGKRSIRRHEPIFHFVKSKDFYYNEEWLKDCEDLNNSFSIGTTKVCPKLTSSLDFFGGVLKTGVASTRELKKKCESRGVALDHQATFPIDVPMICLKLTSKPYDKILDIFNGTAMTGLTVMELGDGREYIGYEPSPEYMLASEIRLSEYELAVA